MKTKLTYIAPRLAARATAVATAVAPITGTSTAPAVARDPVASRPANAQINDFRALGRREGQDIASGAPSGMSNPISADPRHAQGKTVGTRACALKGHATTFGRDRAP